jgi:hypothetical protein
MKTWSPALAGEDGNGWKHPAIAIGLPIIIGLLGLFVAVLAFGRDLYDFDLKPDPQQGQPSTVAPVPSTDPVPAPPTVDAVEVKQRFIAGANAACVNRVQENMAVANHVGLNAQTQNDFPTYMAYMKGATGTSDNLLAALSSLDRPAGDEQRIETMLGYLAESNLSLKSAIDNYERFGPQTPKFQQDIDEGASLEKKFNSAAGVYGLQECV